MKLHSENSACGSSGFPNSLVCPVSAFYQSNKQSLIISLLYTGVLFDKTEALRLATKWAVSQIDYHE